MNPSTDSDSMPAKPDAGTSSFHQARNRQSLYKSVDRPINSWDSPGFEEFDACMEVTTYVHQWE